MKLPGVLQRKFNSDTRIDLIRQYTQFHSKSPLQDFGYWSLMPGDDLRLLADPENACINIEQAVV